MEVFLVCSDSLVRRLVSTRSPAIEIGVRPLEVDVLGDLDFHNRTGPVLLSSDMILEQPDVVFADRCREQLAKIAERVMQVLGFAHLLRIDDPADPDFLEIGVVRIAHSRSTELTSTSPPPQGQNDCGVNAADSRREWTKDDVRVLKSSARQKTPAPKIAK